MKGRTVKRGRERERVEEREREGDGGASGRDGELWVRGGDGGTLSKSR